MEREDREKQVYVADEHTQERERDGVTMGEGRERKERKKRGSREEEEGKKNAMMEKLFSPSYT